MRKRKENCLEQSDFKPASRHLVQQQPIENKTESYTITQCGDPSLISFKVFRFRIYLH